jgi:hypothetical protein
MQQPQNINNLSPVSRVLSLSLVAVLLCGVSEHRRTKPFRLARGPTLVRAAALGQWRLGISTVMASLTWRR